MLLADARRADSTAQVFSAACAMDVTVTRIYSALAPLHRLPFETVELLWRAAETFAFIRDSAPFGRLERELVRISLRDLSPVDAFVVEAAACYAGDVPAPSGLDVPASTDHSDLHRALWITAILRLAFGYCGDSGVIPSAVYATWTDENVYLEFDDETGCLERVARVYERAAALEVLSGRSVIVSCSSIRRAAG